MSALRSAELGAQQVNACLEEAVVVRHRRPHAQSRTEAAWNMVEKSRLLAGWSQRICKRGCSHGLCFSRWPRWLWHPAWVLEGDRAAVH